MKIAPRAMRLIKAATNIRNAVVPLASDILELLDTANRAMLDATENTMSSPHKIASTIWDNRYLSNSKTRYSPADPAL